MTDCLCDICKKKPAIIQIEGEGKYCLDCHNERVLRKFGKDNTFQYAPTMAVMEPGGNVHTFKIEHMILGSMVTWDATELDGYYHFREISDIGENGSAAARKFFKKIVDGVCTKSLDEMLFGSSNHAIPDRTVTTLREKGTIHIIEDEEQDNEIAFVIDGKKFTADELAGLLSTYTNFMLQYQIHDESEAILKEDEYLMPVHITGKSLISELQSAIDIHSDGDFLPYNNTMAFDETFYKIVEKLEVLCSGKKDDAIAAGREMVQLLIGIQTDDDCFPEYEILSICNTVDPYGLDEELKRIVQEWRDSI